MSPLNVPDVLTIPAKNLGPRARQVAQMYLDNPKLSHNKIAQKLGVARQGISKMFQTDRFLNAIQTQVKRDIRIAVPVARDALLDCVTQNRALDVKLRASTRILEETNVIGPNSLTVNVNRIDSMTPQELNTLVQKAKGLGEPVLDAELA